MSIAAMVAWLVVWPMTSPPIVNPSEPPVWASRLTTVALSTYLATTAVDVGQTVYGRRRGYVEANPLLGWLTEYPVAFAALKVGIAVATSAVLMHHSKQHWKRSLILSAILSAVNVAVILHNHRVLNR